MIITSLSENNVYLQVAGSFTKPAHHQWPSQR